MPESANDDVTVVISCFNYGQYLPAAVASAKQQAGGPVRITVVDDGSTDETTQQALRALEVDPEVRLVRQANAGVGAARNAGLAELQTPYAMVLDADDVLAPDAVSRLRAALETDPRAGYAYGHIAFFGAWSGMMRMPAFDPWRLMFRHIVGPTALMRAEMVRDTGGYDVGFPHLEDWEMWVHALARGWHGIQVDFLSLRQCRHESSKFGADRVHYHAVFRALRATHPSLYGQLRRVARTSALGLRERLVYRWVWGPRPWPWWLEAGFYAVWWRLHRGAGAHARSTTRTAR